MIRTWELKRDQSTGSVIDPKTTARYDSAPPLLRSSLSGTFYLRNFMKPARSIDSP
ncbi:hypothetical protein CDL15_Pgr001275 [Punica granatum]|uniref:Uncharacterized protein n=1 Tax=Punica granatum TaxID=22663 RepID=A0A218WLN0_PUNGR|nr:hypothetical protein CDL15_Pgr001275 [Punica granatum]